MTMPTKLRRSIDRREETTERRSLEQKVGSRGK